MFFALFQEHKKTKSLAESVHLATLQLLEQKLGGGTKETTTEIVQTEEPPRAPSPIPEPEPGKNYLIIHVLSFT